VVPVVAALVVPALLIRALTALVIMLVEPEVQEVQVVTGQESHRQSLALL
jgi:hypothetical protein